MRTELVNEIANEALCHLQFYKVLYFVHKNIDKIILVIFSKIIICLIVIHV